MKAIKNSKGDMILVLESKRINIDLIASESSRYCTGASVHLAKNKVFLLRSYWYSIEAGFLVKMASITKCLTVLHVMLPHLVLI